MSRLPIRLRLTAAFAVAMAVILVATGLFLYLRLGSSLDQTINDSLRARADDVAALARPAGSSQREGGGSTLRERGESFAQVVDLAGRVLDTTTATGTPLLSQSELERATENPIFLERDEGPLFEDASRLLAAPIRAEDRRLIVVVGAEVESRNEALSSLLAQLLVGGPIALALASLLAYALAAAALRPVEAMRREAEAVTGSEPGRRLPVPETHDEIARLGATLNEMLARLETALTRERSFVADASHELRTPLALLKTELELALRHPRSVAELEQVVRSALSETDRLAQLAEDLLVLARADQGRLSVRRERVSVEAIAATVAERFALRAPIERDVPPGLEVIGDRVRLEQALSNLVDNALRHGAGPVTIRALAREDAVELHVLDEGPGFAEDFLEHAFDRFTRSDEARSSEGSGLGLAIAAVIARAHGGEPGAANRPGKGADVWLTISRRTSHREGSTLLS